MKCVRQMRGETFYWLGEGVFGGKQPLVSLQTTSKVSKNPPGGSAATMVMNPPVYDGTDRLGLVFLKDWWNGGFDRVFFQSR